MKSRPAITIFLLILASAFTAFSQATPSGTTRVAVINSQAFADPKVGVTRLIKAYSDIDTLLKVKTDELTVLNKRLETIAGEIQQMQIKLNGNPPDAAALRQQISDKNDEGSRLQTDFKRKQEDAKLQFDREEKKAAAPIYNELSAALDAYAKKNGIDLVLDVVKFDGGVFVINNSADITLSFIKDFNAKSSGVPVR